MDRENIIKQIENDYSNELKVFLEANYLLDENYFIDFKLKGLQTVIEKYEDLGEFFIGDDEFKYGKKSANRNLFGYYFLYRELLNLKQNEFKYSKINRLNNNSNYIKLRANENGIELFEYLISNYRDEECSNVKFINILHYLKYNAKKKDYIFKAKQKDYRVFVYERFKIEIKKFAKSEKYEEEEKQIFISLESDYRNIKGVKS